MNFTLAKMLADAALQIDEANRERNLDVLAVTTQMQCTSAHLAGDRVTEIFAPDEEYTPQWEF